MPAGQKTLVSHDPHWPSPELIAFLLEQINFIEFRAVLSPLNWFSWTLELKPIAYVFIPQNVGFDQVPQSVILFDSIRTGDLDVVEVVVVEVVEVEDEVVEVGEEAEMVEVVEVEDEVLFDRNAPAQRASTTRQHVG